MGQRQIVALLSTLATGADLLLLDEFTASMDMASRSESARIVDRAVRDEHFSVAFVSHAETDGLIAHRVIEL